MSTGNELKLYLTQFKKEIQKTNLDEFVENMLNNKCSQ